MSLLPNHRSHDYAHLLRQWTDLAQSAGLRLKTLCKVQKRRVVWLETEAARQGEPAFYLSTGVHGDEPGSVWGLLQWAQKNVHRLRSESFILFPCLNPHGLVLNTRADHRGVDLNRSFHQTDDPICGPWMDVMKGRNLRLSLCLHEDYDAQGSYLYELSPFREAWSRPVLDRSCSRRIPIDPRPRIDGRAAKNGIIKVRKPPKGLPGLPESLVLQQYGCPLCMTFETPSEFALDDRIQCQARFIQNAIRLATDTLPLS